jgi:hypothetical protein
MEIPTPSGLRLVTVEAPEESRRPDAEAVAPEAVTPFQKLLSGAPVSPAAFPEKVGEIPELKSMFTTVAEATELRDVASRSREREKFIKIRGGNAEVLASGGLGGKAHFRGKAGARRGADQGVARR